MLSPRTAESMPSRQARRPLLWLALLASGLLHLLAVGVLPWPEPRRAPGASPEVVLALAAPPATPPQHRVLAPSTVPPVIVSSGLGLPRQPLSLPRLQPPEPMPVPVPSVHAAGVASAAAVVRPPAVPESTHLLLADYADVVQAWLARHRDYPRSARRAGIEGEVLLRLRLGADGRPHHAKVLRSSGAAILDRAALALLARAAPLPPPPWLKDRAMTRTVELDVPVHYRLDEVP